MSDNTNPPTPQQANQAVAQNAKTNCEGSLYIIFAIGQGVATVKSCAIKGFLLNITKRHV